MQFKNIVLALAGLAAVQAQTAAQANGAAQVVVNINVSCSSNFVRSCTEFIQSITTLSKQTNDIAQTISFTNIFTTGVKVINNFRQIVQTVTQDIQSMASTETQNVEYMASDQQSICNAFRDVSLGFVVYPRLFSHSHMPQFVVVHQQLLATVIGKSSIFANTPFTAPMAAVLRAIEGGVDTLAYSLINTVPTCAADATKNKESLDVSLDQSIRAYSY